MYQALGQVFYLCCLIQTSQRPCEVGIVLLQIKKLKQCCSIKYSASHMCNLIFSSIHIE